MASTRKFILADCSDGQHHLIAVDQIKRVGPNNSNERLNTKIVLLCGDVCYTKDSPENIYHKIIKAQRSEL
jgi:hypothetical protein